jgi:predicted DNA-binding transcriptional regulator AlpA
MTKLAATINEAVEISGLSRSAIYKAAKEKRLPIRKNKGRSLVLISELETFLQSLPATEA